MSAEDPISVDLSSGRTSGIDKPIVSGASMSQPLFVERIRVRPDRIETQIRVTDRRFERTDETIIEHVMRNYPTIARHACHNRKGPLFCDVMNDTSTPHLLEHLVVDEQTRHSKDETRIFTGTTQWSRDDELLAWVTFSYEDDLIALEALSTCVAFLNEVLVECMHDGKFE